jgi:hypothetical protein
MRGRYPESVEMRMPAIVSAMLHVVVLGAAVLNLDFFNRPPLMDPEPIMVDFEMVAQKAAAPKVGNPPPQPKDVPIAEEATKAPPPKSAEPPPAPEKPKVDTAEAKPLPPPPVEKPKPEPPKPSEDLIALKPKEPEPPKVEKPPEPPKPAPPVVKKPEPPKPPPPKPQPEKKSVDSMIDDILKNKESPQKHQTPEQQPKPPQQVTRQAPAAPTLNAVVTASEIEGVRSKVRECWFTQGAMKDQNLIITFVVQMNQDGTPVRAELKDVGRYNNDPFFRAAADAAKRAIMNPRCHPWPLSPEKYNSWRNITFNFDPRDY